MYWGERCPRGEPGALGRTPAAPWDLTSRFTTCKRGMDGIRPRLELASAVLLSRGSETLQ